MLRKLIPLIGLTYALTFFGCSTNEPTPTPGNTAQVQQTATTPPAPGQSADEIARIAAQGVGTVTQSSSGVTGIPVIALEEMHNARVGQLQHAITLVRLHDKYGLRDIVLEGYLKERPNIDTDWFSRAVGGKTPEARAKVAVQFLKQGDISAAEFMKLVYTDITLHQAEYGANYNVESPARFGHVEYLEKIAEVDRSWAEEKAKPYQSLKSFQSMSGDEKLKSAKDIKEYAEAHNISVSPESKQAMEQFITFLEKRLASNKTINEVATSVAAAGATVVAINIGSDHTQNICQIFKDSNRPYAVVKPLYTPGSEDRGNLTDSMYERKNRKLPVFSQGLSALILQEVSAGKKPEPVIPEDWFGAEAEMYGFVDKLAVVILGPPTPPGAPNGGKPPFGFSDSDFDGKWIGISPARVEYFANKDERSRSLLIPLTFKRSGNTVWVGAVLSREQEQGQETVEAILTHALQNVQAESATPQQAEDQTGRVQMSVTTFAVVGRDKNAVKQAILSVS